MRQFLAQRKIELGTLNADVPAPGTGALMARRRQRAQAQTLGDGPPGERSSAETRPATWARLEEALRESEAEYRLLADNMVEMVAMVGLDGRFTYASPSFLRALGWSPEDVTRMRFRELIHPEDYRGVAAGLKSLGPTGYLVSEYRVRCKDGSYVWTESMTQLLHDADGTPRCYLASGRDVTRRRAAEEELRLYRERLEELVAARTAELAVAKERAEVADRLKSAFLASMSHELRTPLNSILGFTTILLGGLAGPLVSEQRRQLGMVQASAEHLLELINDVLDLSKIEAGQLEVEWAQVDLGAVVTRVLESIEPLAARKQLAVSATIAPEVGTVVSDRHRVEQVLLNLLSNAVKFTAQGSITVSCTLASDRVVTAVRDTGIGIREADVERLFRPFQQLEQGMARRYDGTGLGLSICRRLVELLGGEVWVESEWGRGSTFYFTLPVTARRPG